MKNGVYFIVIALLVAELFKVLIYASEMTWFVTRWTQNGISLKIFFRIELNLCKLVISQLFHDNYVYCSCNKKVHSSSFWKLLIRWWKNFESYTLWSDQFCSWLPSYFLLRLYRKKSRYTKPLAKKNLCQNSFHFSPWKTGKARTNLTCTGSCFLRWELTHMSLKDVGSLHVVSNTPLALRVLWFSRDSSRVACSLILAWPHLARSFFSRRSKRQLADSVVICYLFFFFLWQRWSHRWLSCFWQVFRFF